MRHAWLFGLALVGCNALTGASDLVTGDDNAAVPGDGADGGRPPVPDATTPRGDGASDAAVPSDAAPDRLPAPDGGLTVFTTSLTTPGTFGSLAQADSICSLAALNGGLGANHQWRAWVSVSTGGGSGQDAGATNAIDRLTSNGPWYLPSGVLAVASKTSILNDAIEHPIDETETGQPVPGEDRVWTGTTTGVASGANCSNWSVGQGSGGTGKSSRQAADWSASGTATCTNGNLHLYCFEQ
jgi:hypothetical protein